MSQKTIDDLRGHLFDTLEALADKNNPMDINRAKAIANVAQTIINSAKVEIDYLRVADADVPAPKPKFLASVHPLLIGHKTKE